MDFREFLDFFYANHAIRKTHRNSHPYLSRNTNSFPFEPLLGPKVVVVNSKLADLTQQESHFWPKLQLGSDLNVVRRFAQPARFHFDCSESDYGFC
jgi:hypothetical protein